MLLFWGGALALSCGGATDKHAASSTHGGGGGTGAGAAGGAPMAGGGRATGGAGAQDEGASAGELASAGAPVDGGAAGEAGSPSQTIDERCPSEQPRSHAGCTTGLRCSYGSDLRPWCRIVAACENDHWEVVAPGCNELEACPAFFPDMACDPLAYPAICSNSDAHACRCLPKGAGYSWRCSNDLAASICPVQVVPNEGAACDHEIECYYQPCLSSASGTPNWVATCNGTRWTYTATCMHD
jgi:hypothetical protein